MLLRHAASARKALFLGGDPIFRFLFMALVLLCFLAGAGAAGYAAAGNFYEKWHLERQSVISLFILPETDPALVDELMKTMGKIPGVMEVSPVPKERTATLLEPFFEVVEGFPLPLVVDVRVSENLDRSALDQVVEKILPDAEMEDARTPLAQVARVVNLARWAALGVAALVLAVMAFLVALAVRVGMEGKRRHLSIMQVIGATDGFLIDLLVRQVALHCLIGWLGGVLLTAGALFAVLRLWPATAGVVGPNVWLVAALTPLALAFAAIVAGALVARGMFGRGQGV